MTARGIIALDADGVLLDYGLAYAGAWQKAFGQYPRERDPLAYWPIDRWAVERVADERLATLRRCFDEEFWCAIPPVPGTVEACHLLTAAGFELVCVTALPEEFRAARERNLRALGFPIDMVHATDNMPSGGNSPKAEMLHRLHPQAFVDDYLPYLIGIDSSIHRALIMRAVIGSPNHSEVRRCDLPTLSMPTSWRLRNGGHSAEMSRTRDRFPGAQARRRTLAPEARSWAP